MFPRMIHLPDRLLQKFNKVRKFIMKHFISEFVLPTGRGSVNTHTMQRVGVKVREIRAASKGGWWNGNREVEVNTWQ